MARGVIHWFGFLALCFCSMGFATFQVNGTRCAIACIAEQMYLNSSSLDVPCQPFCIPQRFVEPQEILPNHIHLSGEASVSK